MEDFSKYGLDLHCTMILEEYVEARPVFEEMQQVLEKILHEKIKEQGIYVNAIETRIKTLESLAGKLERKGNKYDNLMSLTDIVGARIITFYTDEVDKIAALVDKVFEIDWQNSVDKRKIYDLRSFGYTSLHYICRIPKSLYFNPEHPEINEYRFELQMRTALQHVWATMDHDTGYKSGVEIPREYLRNMSRLAGMLELIDEQFSAIRTGINDYRRQVQALVSDGHFEEVSLDGDTFRSYLQLKPFDKLVKRIAKLNQAEVHETNVMPYLSVMLTLGFKTLADVDNLVKEYSEDAYELAAYQIATTDIDIISSAIGIQDLLVVYVLENGGGVLGLEMLFEIVNGPSDYNRKRAQTIMDSAANLKFMNK